MNVYQFLTSEKSANWSLIIFMSALSGVAGASILAIINVAASVQGADGAAGTGKDRLVLLFLLAIVILIFAKRLSLARTTDVVENLVADFRLRLCEKLRVSELEVIESLDSSETFSTINQDTRLISQTGFVITSAGQQMVMLVMGALYLAYLSQVAFLLFAFGAGLGAWLFLGHRKSLLEAYREDSDKQTELFSYLGHLLYGFKEVRLNEQKGDEILSLMASLSQESRQLRMKTNMFFMTSSIYAEVTLYALLGAIIFILPQLIPTYSDVLMKATVAVMFVFGPLGGVVMSLPQIANANTALAKLYNLEQTLDSHLDEVAYLRAVELPSLAEFQKITMHGVVFSYAESGGQDGFTVGPFDLEIRRGEILFLVGGNGSGKTTLLKLITGLYGPQSGELHVDHKVVTRRVLPAYRHLFAGVFSDFHLCDRLYGLGEIDEEVAHRLVEKMEIAHKVDIAEGRFTTLELSTGQRKRLALIASLLEDRQIYIFDEWTADQDPHFREQFYGVILPELQQQGKTIIAITHDDRYWNRADRVIRLDYGQIAPL